MASIPRRRKVAGDRLGGYIYGTIIVLATLVAGAEAYRNGAGHIAILVLITTFVFWLAHVYSHVLAHSVAAGHKPTAAEVVKIAHREDSIIEAAILPVTMLVLGKLDVFSVHAAIWLAFACGIGVLVGEGVRYAKAESLGVLGTATVVTANVVMGLLLVALKLWVSH